MKLGQLWVFNAAMQTPPNPAPMIVTLPRRPIIDVTGLAFGRKQTMSY